MSQIFLSERHPETGAFDGREVLCQTFQFFVIHQIRFARTYIRIVQRLVYRQRICIFPFSVFEIFTTLGNFADVDFRIEVRSECFVMIACVAVDDVQIPDFVEMMFRCISCIYPCYARIESASQNRCQPRFFKTVFIGPLPAIFIFRFVQRFVVGGVEVADTVSQTGVHDGEVLIR